MVRPRRVLATIAFLFAAAALATPWIAGRTREARLARAVPALDREMRRHIAMDSDPSWRSYCRRAGTAALGVALRELLPALRTTDFREFERNRGPVEAAQLRLGVGFRELHGIDALERRARNDIALSAGDAFEWHQWERRYFEISSGTSGTPKETWVPELDGIAQRFLASGDSGRALFAAVAAAKVELEQGRLDHHNARIGAAVALARSLREYSMLCQLLGEMGYVHRHAGRVDSMQACYDEGLALARRYALVDQAARLLRFNSSYYAERGQMAVATDLLSEALRIADGPGGAEAQPRLQIEYTRFLASQGWWDLVERSLRRVPPLLRRMSAPGLTEQRARYGFDAELLMAQLDFATGRVEAGDLRMRRLLRSVPPGAQRAGLADLLDEWSLGLEAANRREEALEICSRALTHCDTASVPEYMPRLLLRAARLEAACGRLDAAGSLLDSVTAMQESSPGAGPNLVTEAEVLRARLLFLRGRTQLARRQIEELYDRLSARAEGGLRGSAGTSGALAIRDAIHEIEPFTPEQGYQFEMEWRSRTRPSPFPFQGDGEPEAFARRWTRRRPPGTHLVYRFVADALVRWTVDAERAVVDTIPLSAERCLVEVREALERLQSEPALPGGFLGLESLARLRRLSGLLLPPSLAASRERPLRLDITPDGPLSALPFEALPFPSSAAASPLALTADIAYVQSWSGTPPQAQGDAVIVANPVVSEPLTMRYAATGYLRESEAEAREALERWPNATVLSGEAATKDAIRRHWPGASIIYVAAHHVRDPDAPFLGFVPLPAPPGAPPDASVLESADIRALDLSACRLAVLASCASGAPYRTAPNPGPSLGDAFLDAGGAAVVRSFWDVGDAEARDFMKVFLSHWRADRPEAVSLGRARREVMRSPLGDSPRVWAVWSVQVSGP